MNQTEMTAGYGIVPQKVMTDRTLNCRAKALYAYLSTFADKDRRCFPSLKKVCADLDVTADTASGYFKALTEKGYLRIEKVRDKGRFSRNVYTLCQPDEPYPENPGTAEPDTEKPGMAEPDTEKPGMAEPDTEKPGMAEPYTEKPLPENPGTNNTIYNNTSINNNKNNNTSKREPRA